MSQPAIIRKAQDVTVTLWRDGWPRTCEIQIDDSRQHLRLMSTTQLRALHWALGECLAADPDPDDRPRLR